MCLNIQDLQMFGLKLNEVNVVTLTYITIIFEILKGLLLKSTVSCSAAHSRLLEQFGALTVAILSEVGISDAIAVSMLAHRRRRTNIETALGECPVLAGLQASNKPQITAGNNNYSSPWI